MYYTFLMISNLNPNMFLILNMKNRRCVHYFFLFLHEFNLGHNVSETTPKIKGELWTAKLL